MKEHRVNKHISPAVSAAFGALAAIILLGAASTVALRNDGIQFPDGSVQTSAANSPGVTIPVTCERLVDVGEMQILLPLDCTAMDGTEFQNVPPGYYLYVTDVFVRRKLSSQTEVELSLQIWRDDVTNPTGCLGGAPVGTFGTTQGFEWTDYDQTSFHHVAYQTPYFVLTPNDCINVFVLNDSVSGAKVELSGFLWDRLGAPLVGSSGV